MMRRVLRWLMWGGVGLVALASIGAAVAYVILDRQVNDDRHKPKVLAAPPGTLNAVPRDPYAGPHPRLASRPREWFAFPLQPGDVGPVEPLFAGSARYPFLCRTVESDLGQPRVDNQRGWGMAVFAEDEDGEPTDQVIGYSKDCLLATRIEYWSYSMSEERWAPASEIDVADRTTVRLDGGAAPLRLRVEVGTINRHIYLIVVPVGDRDEPAGAPDLTPWNRRLVYYFRGGVGIGRRQGHTAIGSILRRRAGALMRGYAVAYSSANQTSTSYDIGLAEDTARRVKRQFETAYGVPEYTVGIGGSGGAIQQYLLGQNAPGLLDGAIALYSYPDMITQSIHVLDCELLEHYFDVTDASNTRWSSVAARAQIEGMNHGPLKPRFWQVLWPSYLAQGLWPPIGRGTTECARAWRGMSAQVLNPRYAHFMGRFAPELAARVEWTYWADLVTWFGREDSGYTRRTWDNVGVQYGLRALRERQIDVSEFLQLNRRVGGWKAATDMAPERYYLSEVARSALADYAPSSHHNMTLEGDPAPRSRADAGAITAAWQSGQVFTGVIDIPVIDLRHYLEDELDMHHASASFSTRLRIMDAMGDASHQVIWMTRRPHEPYVAALDAIDDWLRSQRAEPNRSAGANRPQHVVDRCWDHDGAVLAEGEGVWDGDWNGKPAGPCMTRYPIFGTSRQAAGETLRGDTFACTLEPVADAVARGVYRPHDMARWMSALESVFPDGVCRTDVPGRDYPDDLVMGLLGTLSAGREPRPD